ncbi:MULTISPECIES: DegV family protein [Arthrobacter]|uniref:DegV family protein n=2 Tax=Arthrobacter TaxID=1663 RepID=A0ABU9KGT7_9MICC|nr:DegV family protein [Arthrobacter sp. YJM1]MDP5226028.1 DegV family protein [Arthrobacter sp. YJM1]
MKAEPGVWSWGRLLERLEAFRALGSAGLRPPRQTARGPRGKGVPEPPAVRVAVVTDSAAALPAEWLAQAPPWFRHVPLPVMVGEEIFSSADLADDDGALLERLSLAMAVGEPVKTSRPSPATLAAAYRDLAAAGYGAIVSVHLSRELSGTADAARLAAESCPVPVDVVDSRTAAMCLGFAVQAACAMASQGAPSELVKAAAETSLASSTVHFYVPSLEQLRRGGRIGGAASWLGTMLAIKPILGIADGRVVPVEKVRSSARALARLEELAVAAAADIPESSLGLAVHHFGSAQAARELADRLQARLPEAPPPVISSLPAVLAAHVGLGVLAIVSAQLPPERLSP